MILSEDKFPKTWDELKSMVDFIKSSPIDNLRSSENQLFYSSYLNRVDKDIRMKVLFDSFAGKDKIILKPSFPYSNLIKFLPHVIHYCLWNRNGKVPDNQIEADIKAKFPHQDYFWFENDSIVKSIPEVWHCHIFVKEQ